MLVTFFVFSLFIHKNNKRKVNVPNKNLGYKVFLNVPSVNEDLDKILFEEKKKDYVLQKKNFVYNLKSKKITIFCRVTAYSPTVEECDSSPTITASGKHVYVGGIASDWSVLPCGSLVIIQGYNNNKVCEVIDTGSAIVGNRLDVFFRTKKEAINWGVKNISVILERYGEK